MGSPSPTEWPALLRAQGRSMTWLASELGVSRTYLADVAAGRRQASRELQDRIALTLRPDRLGQVREHARWREIELGARSLADKIHRALGSDAQ